MNIKLLRQRESRFFRHSTSDIAGKKTVVALCGSAAVQVGESICRLAMFDAFEDVSKAVVGYRKMANTSQAVTATFTYDPTFNQITSFTDPLNHVTTFS
jgi:hypothetical protein